jgi:hypothetical protein
MFRRSALVLLLMMWLPLRAAAACNLLPTSLVSEVPVGVWRPGTEREWMNVGLIRFSSNAIQLSNERYQLCFVEKLKSRGEVSTQQGGTTPVSDVLVYAVDANKGKRPYSSRYLGVAQYSEQHTDGTKENWVEAYWCQKLEDIRGGRFWCSMNHYVCESGACLTP